MALTSLRLGLEPEVSRRAGRWLCGERFGGIDANDDVHIGSRRKRGLAVSQLEEGYALLDFGWSGQVFCEQVANLVRHHDVVVGLHLVLDAVDAKTLDGFAHHRCICLGCGTRPASCQGRGQNCGHERRRPQSHDLSVFGRRPTRKPSGPLFVREHRNGQPRAPIATGFELARNVLVPASCTPTAASRQRLTAHINTPEPPLTYASSGIAIGAVTVTLSFRRAQ
jgi:hypothetical protein